MRASIPSLFVVQYYVIHHIFDIRYRRKRLGLALFCAIWAIGSLNSFREIGKHIIYETQPLKRRRVAQISDKIGQAAQRTAQGKKQNFR
jgi:hypothetical protein